MKTDEDVTKKQVNAVFAEEKKKESKREKELRKRKRKQVGISYNIMNTSSKS